MGHTAPSVTSSCLLAALIATSPVRADSGADTLAPIVVTATLRATSLEQTPASVTVLDAATLSANAQQHFEDVLPLVPNLNWAGDTSRPRYFQIRGIGELQQYQGAPNPSVGFLIDDIDFSGLGSAATLFDVDRIEVLRGPQGSVYGANALAGLISVQSAAPEARFAARAELDAGDYGERSYGAVVTGPIAALDSSFRLAAQRYTADGFYRNAYLGRDTDARDELTVRGRWRLQPGEAWRLDVSVLRAAMNNGYDAFAIDNSRTTQSDHPSADRQFSTGASARSTLELAAYTFTAIATYADSTIHYGFDGDWGNARLWAPYTYDFTDEQRRYRSTRSLELRLGRGGDATLSWLIGVYGFELQESLTERSAGTYVDPFDPSASSATLTMTDSRFTARSGALYAQLDGRLNPRLRWSASLRGERHVSRYAEQTTDINAPDTTHHFAPADNLWGGNVSLDVSLTDAQTVYALVSRGYKASGFNLGAGLPDEQRAYTPEWDLNLEIGHKALFAGGRLRTETSLFYMARHREQLLTGEQLNPSDPNTFIYYTGNAGSGFNYGLESSARFAPERRFEFNGSLGLLQTRYRGFIQNGARAPRPRPAPCTRLAGCTRRHLASPIRRIPAPRGHRHGRFLL